MTNRIANILLLLACLPVIDALTAPAYGWQLEIVLGPHERPVRPSPVTLDYKCGEGEFSLKIIPDYSGDFDFYVREVVSVTVGDERLGAELMTALNEKIDSENALFTFRCLEDQLRVNANLLVSQKTFVYRLNADGSIASWGLSSQEQWEKDRKR